MIRCTDLVFRYPGESFELRVGSLAVEEGESVALVGPSGCGKTTLLNLLAGLLTPRAGRVEVLGCEITAMNFPERQQFRLARIGMVPQTFELLDYLTVLENLLLPFHLSGEGKISPEHLERGKDLAERAGISFLLGQYPGQLSQGERQRLALCRGLVSSPALVLADEPTGNLDPENQEKVVDLLLSEAEGIGATVVMITHEPTLKPRFERVVDVLALRKEVKG